MITENNKYKERDGINSVQSSLKSHPVWFTLQICSCPSEKSTMLSSSKAVSKICLQVSGGIPWLLLMAFLYITGALLYGARIPERFLPGKFDLW